MENAILYKILYVLSFILIIGFFVLLVVDWYRYNNMLNSAPFYIFAVVRGIEFIIPGTILFLIAGMVKRKNKL